MTEAPAVNASPLILLARTAHLHLLKSLAQQLIVPEPVLEARSHALSLQIPLIGTLGVVLRAKRLGMIHQARPVVESLVAKGMYLSKSVVEKALALSGE